MINVLNCKNSLRRFFFVICMLCLFSSVAVAQITITGTVSDITGESMPGVSISLKGTGTGTMSDLDGHYSLSVPNANSALTFSFIGYVTQEITVGNKTLINVQMKEDIQSIDEVVVVGYGVQKKVNLSGAVAQVNGDVLENRPITNIGQGLQGVIPNLQITPGSNRLGGSANFNVRGETSINGGGPLILVDGVVMDPNLVNPNDIASITVLKDASSAAIYGARAAYGVVLMTTKKGQANMKPIISVNASVSTSAPTVLPKGMDSWHYANYMNLISRNAGGGDHFDARQMGYIKRYYDDPKNNPSAYYDPAIDTDESFYKFCGNTDWMDLMYKNSAMQQYGINLRGGSDKTRYYVSYGFMSQTGVLKTYDDQYKRHTINMDITSDIFKWLTFGAKVKYTHSYQDTPSTTIGWGWKFTTGNMISPLLPLYLPDSDKYPENSYAAANAFDNPFAANTGGSKTSKVNDLWVTGTVVLRPLKDLNINTEFTFNPYSWSETNTNRLVTQYKADGTTFLYPHTNPNGVQEQNSNDYYTALNIYADYTKSFSRHNFKVMLGYNQEIKTHKWAQAIRKGLIDNDFPILNLATGEQTVNGDQSSWAVQGVFGRINYDFDERYLFEVSGRYDGSSKFASGKRFALFPSFSAAWRIGKENFMSDISFLSDLKVRASYGSLGNQNVGGDFPYLASYGINTNQGYIVDGSKGVAIGAPGLVSPNFTWEKVTQWNVGLDWGFFNYRLSGSFDFYNRFTKGMLTDGQPLPGVLGASVPRENAADLKTVGWEFTLGWKDRIGDLNYSASFVLSDSQGEVTKFDNPTRQIGKHYAGEKFGEIWGFKTDGLFQTQEQLDHAPDMTALNGESRNLGDVRFRDIDGDGKVDFGDNTVNNPGDRSILGNSTPRYQYGITLGVEWKGIDFTVFFQGVGKRDWFPGGEFFGNSDQWGIPLVAAGDFWREGDEVWSENTTGALLPRPYINGDHGNRQTSDRYLQDASYLRLKQLSIGYTFPKKWISKIALNSARIYFTGQNLLTFTGLSKIYDPEVYNGGVVYLANNHEYPVSRTYSVGINVSF